MRAIWSDQHKFEIWLEIETLACEAMAELGQIPKQDASEIRSELEHQVARPVRWHESVTAMAAAGVSTFIEFGSGRVLTGMIRRLQPQAKLVNISSFVEGVTASAEA